MIRVKPLHLLAAAPLLMSLTGCVAAIPMAAQALSGATSVAQLCSAAKLPGQSASMCERIPFASNTQTPARTTIR